MRLLLIFAIIACFTNAPMTAMRSKDKERKKDRLSFKSSATSSSSAATAKNAINLCTNEEPNAQIHCFCSGGGGSEPGNVTSTECWVFDDKLTADYPGWAYFINEPHMKSMRILVKPHGNLTFVPTKALRHLKELHKFEIIYGTIGEIHAFAFANLSKLSVLQMSRNQISSMAPNAFAHLHNLSELSLDENRIRELQRDVFIDVPALRKLFITQNQLSVIQERAFKHLSKLVELELATNFISVLTKETFHGLSDLKRLDLSYNKINMLGDLTFTELWVLEELLLESNQIEMITDRAFAGLTNLRLLNLRNNKLSVLSPTLLGGVPGIYYLDLRSNSLETLTIDNVRPILANLFNATSSFYVENNRFVCDCRLIWIHSFRNETKNERIQRQLDKLLCYWDPELADEDNHAVGPAKLSVPSHPLTMYDNDNAFPKDEDFDDGNYYANSDYSYDPQQDGSAHRRSDSNEHRNSQAQGSERGNVVETTRDPSERIFFQIPVNRLPCAQNEVPTEETLRKHLHTPMHSEISAGRRTKIASIAFYLLGLLISLSGTRLRCT